VNPGDFVRIHVPRIPALIPSALQPGNLYIMDLCDTHTQVLTTISGENVGYTQQGDVCLVLQIEPNHVKFLTHKGIPGWIHRDCFYPPDLPGD